MILALATISQFVGKRINFAGASLFTYAVMPNGRVVILDESALSLQQNVNNKRFTNKGIISTAYDTKASRYPMLKANGVDNVSSYFNITKQVQATNTKFSLYGIYMYNKSSMMQNGMLMWVRKEMCWRKRLHAPLDNRTIGRLCLRIRHLLPAPFRFFPHTLCGSLARGNPCQWSAGRKIHCPAIPTHTVFCR